MHRIIESNRETVEIIGKAMNRLALHDAETAGRISRHRWIIDFRNVLIHGHDLIDHRIVWSTSDEEIPVLPAAVGALLNQRP
jgi:uncharacterized protein with HEPN domain